MSQIYNEISHSLISGKSTSVIANGLIKLRQLCTSVYDLNDAGGTALLNKGTVDADLVSDITSKSCKMAALSSLLPTYTESERILILASLPSTLNLLHLFLTASSVPHSTLVSPYTPTPSSVQLAVEGFEKREFRVLCASGTGLWGGLVPRDCHVVIVDEDWSGRQTLQLENLMRKVRPKSVKRVVSEDTIEDHIFRARTEWVSAEIGDTSDAGIDDFGIVGGGNSGFVLGKGLIELRGKLLTEVLKCPEPYRPSTPPAATDTSVGTFLPR